MEVCAMSRRKGFAFTSLGITAAVLCLLIGVFPASVAEAGGFCSGTLDPRGANCNTWKRYQCGWDTDCAAHSCTFYGASCFWMCHWEPGASTCEYTCDPKPITPCQYRTAESFCELGWGCSWTPTNDPGVCTGTLDYRGANCNTWKRYQCAPGTDCEANSCAFYGAGCFWMCHWEPGADTCEYTCDSKPVVPCTERNTQELCELGWGCSWQ